MFDFDINKEENRSEYLLLQCLKLLQRQEDSPYVLNLLDELIIYDDSKCDGSCLKEDITLHLEEKGIDFEKLMEQGEI